MNLLIFIDGLSFKNSKKMTFLNDFKVKKIIPGIGFSNNIYAEIVTGKTPDQIGYFNEWTLKKSIRNSSRIPLYFLDSFRNIKYLNLAVRFLLKKIGFNFFNIPFAYFHNFKSNGPHHFNFFKSPNLVKDFNFSISDASQIERGVGKRDEVAISNLYKLNSSNIFLSLVDLDNISHIYGVNSSQYNRHLKFLNYEILRVLKFFIKKNSQERLNVFVFSDHGMSNVRNIVDFKVESYFGKPSSSTYHYFIDSTFLRIWTFNKRKNSKFLRFLKGINYGHVIDKNHRKIFGITNKEFGDIIFRLNEGFMFAPNFFGVRPCKSMHGYSSYLENQKAFFASNSTVNLKNVKFSRDIYNFLVKNL